MNKISKISLAVVASLLIAAVSYGTALSAARNTEIMLPSEVNIGVLTNAVIYAGAMVAVTNVGGVGYAVPATDAGSITIVGMAQKSVDATATASGSKTVNVRTGCFYWNGDSGALSKGAIGQIAYVVDDNTVSCTNAGSHSAIAGVVMDYNSIAGTVAVDTRSFASSQAASLASLGVSGNATVGGTLAVTGVGTFTAAPVLTAGISGGVSVTNTFYTVTAGTAACITNVVKSRSGIVVTGTTTL